MAKTKEQKIKELEKGIESLKKSETVVFADFTGSTVSELQKLRKMLNESGAKFSVIKKRLLKIMLQKLGIELDLKQFAGQLGFAFSPKKIFDVAGPLYKFAKESVGADKQQKFKIIGGFDLIEKKFINADEIKLIGQLPPRQILLGQLLGAISGPLRAFLYVLNEKGRKS